MPIALKEIRRKNYLRNERDRCKCGLIKSKNAKICWRCYIKNKSCWSKGLTKDTDKRLLAVSEKHKNSYNPMWKGNKVGCNSLHAWIKRRKSKPDLCECCKNRAPKDLANISGKYKRDVNDYEWLCRKCHMKKDNRLNKLGLYKKINIDIKSILYKRYMEGKSHQKIADELNVSRSLISSRLRGDSNSCRNLQ